MADETIDVGIFYQLSCPDCNWMSDKIPYGSNEAGLNEQLIEHINETHGEASRMRIPMYEVEE